MPTAYSWGKAAKNGKKKGSSKTVKKPAVKIASSGAKKTKRIKTGY